MFMYIEQTFSQVPPFLTRNEMDSYCHGSSWILDGTTPVETIDFMSIALLEKYWLIGSSARRPWTPPRENQFDKLTTRG